MQSTESCYHKTFRFHSNLVMCLGQLSSATLHLTASFFFPFEAAISYFFDRMLIFKCFLHRNTILRGRVAILLDWITVYPVCKALILILSARCVLPGKHRCE